MSDRGRGGGIYPYMAILVLLYLAVHFAFEPPEKGVDSIGHKLPILGGVEDE